MKGMSITLSALHAAAHCGKCNGQPAKMRGWDNPVIAEQILEAECHGETRQFHISDEDLARDVVKSRMRILAWAENLWGEPT